MIAQYRVPGSRPAQADAGGNCRCGQRRGRADGMQAQCRIAHQCDVDTAQETIHLVLIKPAVVLAQTNAVTNRFAETHVLVKVMRSARPGTGQPECRRRQHRAHDVVLGIPVSQPTAEHHHKNGLGIGIHNIGAPDVVVTWMRAQAAHGRVTAGAAAVGPQITVHAQQ